MNLLYEYDHSDNRHLFCRQNSISYARLSRLASTRNNLRQRVAKCLDLQASTLSLKLPPRQMSESKLLALRIINVWLFHDAIMKLPKQKVRDRLMEDGSYSIDLKGDEIQESHLTQILDKNRHNFSLHTECCMLYNAVFKPVQMDDQFLALAPSKVEERLLSLSIERDFTVIVSRVGAAIQVYISAEKAEAVKSLIEDSCYFEGTLVCRTVKSNSGGNCGAWKVHYTEDRIHAEGNTEMSFVKYAVKGNTHSKNKKGKKKNDTLKRFRELFQSRSFALQLNTLVIDIPRETGGAVNIFSYTSSSCEITKLDLVGLFRTPDVKMHKSPNSVKRQTVVCREPPLADLEGSPPEIASSYITSNLPEGARILHAVAAGRRNNPVIRFQYDIDNSTADGQTEEGNAYLEVQLNRSEISNKWYWTETGEVAILDTCTIPATVAPQHDDIYACCGNILELKGGRVVAEGLTLLPAGELFLGLAKRCIGIESQMEKDCDDNLAEAADLFYEFFRESEDELKYLPHAVDLLSDVFHSLDGLELKPWDVQIEAAEELTYEDMHNHLNPLRKGNHHASSSSKGQLSNAMPKYQASNLTNPSPKVNPPASLSATLTGHISKSKPQYKCLMCNDGPFKWKTLRSHIDSHHGGKPIPSLQQHTWRFQESAAKMKSPVPASTGLISKSKKYKCLMCNDGPFKWKTLRSHIDSHHGGKPIQPLLQNTWRVQESVAKMKSPVSASTADGGDDEEKPAVKIDLEGAICEELGSDMDNHTDPPPMADPHTSSSSTLTGQESFKRPQYKCLACNNGPFSFKALITHIDSKHGGQPKLTRKNKKWRFKESVAERESPVPVSTADDGDVEEIAGNGDAYNFKHVEEGVCEEKKEEVEVKRSKEKCFSFRAKGKCKLGDECPYSHDFEPKKSEEQVIKIDAKDKECFDWLTKRGCRKGDTCPYRHDESVREVFLAEGMGKKSDKKQGSNMDNHTDPLPQVDPHASSSLSSTVSKIKPRYKCLMCKDGPFKWEALGIHIVKKHGKAIPSVQNRKAFLVKKRKKKSPLPVSTAHGGDDEKMDLGEALCNELGSDNVPSSFMNLFSEMHIVKEE